MINEDSLRKCLNDFDIKVGNSSIRNEDGLTENDLIIEEMLRIANGNNEESIIGREAFGSLFQDLKLKIDLEGRVN